MATAYTARIATELPANQASEVALNQPISGTAGQPYIDPANTVLGIDNTMIAVRAKHQKHFDVQPERAGTLRFGDKVTVKFGQEFPGALVGQEWIFKLPRLRRFDGTFNATDGNPEDPLYVGAHGAVTAVAGDFLQWRPNIGELLVSAIGDYFEKRHGQEILDRTISYEVFTKRRLCDDDQSNAPLRSAYINGIGGGAPLSTAAPVDLVVRIATPWGVDKPGLDFHRYLQTAAFALDFEYSFRLPPLNELVHCRFGDAGSDVSTSINVSDSSMFPTVFLRNHYFNTPQDQKQKDIALFMNGLNLKVTRMISERQVEVPASSQEVEVPIDLEAAKLPVGWLFITVTYKDDLRKTGEIATAADGRTDLLVKRTFNRSGQEILVRPNAHNHQEIRRWWLQDQSERVTPVYDMHSQMVSQMSGHATLFPSTPTEKIAIISPSTDPSDDRHCLGHHDFTTMHKPRLFVVLAPNIATDATQTRVIRVTHCMPQTLIFKGGQARLAIAHPLSS